MALLREVPPGDPIHAVNQIVPYCAGCNRSWEPDPKNRLGTRFICPVDKRHLAAIVKGEPGKLWLRIEARILRYELISLGFFHFNKKWSK